MNKKYVILLFIAGMLTGIAVGMWIGIEIVIHQIMKILPHFVDIKIDEVAMKDALFKYANQIH